MRDTTPPPIVGILLSTYNGAAFLHEQLASFDAQDGASWRLFWRDDGSSDGSVAIMRAYAASRPHVVQLDDAAHLGVTGSYMSLLRHAVAHGTGPVAFADQDDVWMGGKLARALHALREQAGAGPLLYCSRQVLVDVALNRLGESDPIRVPPSLCPALTQNIATGCTVVLDAAAAALVAGSAPPSASLHDWWSYLVVTAAGGRVIADHDPTVKYRQHPQNAVGAPGSKRRRAMAALRRGPAAYMALLRAHVRALRDQPALLSPEARESVAAIGSALDGGLVARLRVLRRFGLLRQTRAETWLFRCWFLLG